jgi:hypothetical protein
MARPSYQRPSELKSQHVPTTGRGLTKETKNLGSINMPMEARITIPTRQLRYALRIDESLLLLPCERVVDTVVMVYS